MKVFLNGPLANHCARLLLAVLMSMLLFGCGESSRHLDFDKALDQGWTFFQVGEFNQSEKYFKEAIAKAGSDHLKQAEALYAMGMNHGFRRPKENITLAREYFQKVVDMDHGGELDLAPWCLLAEARLLALVAVGKEIDVPKLREAYEKVVAQYPFHPAGEEAFIYQQLTYIETSNADEIQKALPKLESFLKNHPQSKYRSQAEALISDGYWFLGDHEQQLKHLISSAELTETNPQSPRDNSVLYFRIASIAQYEVGDLEVARKYYTKFLTENRTDKRRFNAKLALKQIDNIEAAVRAGKTGGTKS